jgi:hypothetical protein
VSAQSKEQNPKIESKKKFRKEKPQNQNLGDQKKSGGVHHPAGPAHHRTSCDQAVI